jgi:hypothetical protein
MMMLLGNEKDFENELKKYNNETRRKKTENQIKSFEKSIKSFQYKAQEIICELGGFYNFAIRYYGRHILNLVYQHQKYDENILHETYNYLRDFMTKNELEFLHNDYKNYTKHKKIKYDINSASIKVKAFFIKFSRVFDLDETISQIYRNNHHNNVTNFIEYNNMQDFLSYCFEHDLKDLFLYLYIFFDTQFDYNNILYIKHTDNQKDEDNINSVKEISNSGGISENANIFISESKNKIMMIQELLYLRKYSRIVTKSIYCFVKKYGSRLKYFADCDYDELFRLHHD